MGSIPLLEAMHRDWGGASDTVLRVDGGMVASDWMMQRLADILNAPVFYQPSRSKTDLRVYDELRQNKNALS